MDWWSSLDRAGNLSKLAFSALKNAQERIDAVLDIQDEGSDSSVSHPLQCPSELQGSVRVVPAEPPSADPLLSSNTPTADKENLPSCARDFPDISVDRLHELQLSGEPDCPTPCDVRSVSPVHSTEIPSPETISRPHTPTGILEVHNTSTTATDPPHSPISISPINTFPVTVQYPSRFSKSCSEGDLSVDTLSPIAVTPTRNLRVSVEEDVETTTTGSDIEVISCCTSTNGESLPVHYQASLSQTFPTTHSNDVINCPAGKTGRQFDAGQLTINVPAAFRGHSAPMTSSHSCLRRHRRAVSQDYRHGLCGPNEEDLFFAFQRLSKSYSDKKHLLGVREAKILELSRENCELRDANALLQA
ncbi:hypothetical protein P879_08539 [Paragonimus westermani]|uniref:Uncharacterized protein n=1 Tax=Paragonimus westermani TaxID=34504 RepID=A0A8T0DDY2_9TREM|nr:hypothetical protein P879_08539 [Paragonimus westermani]